MMVDSGVQENDPYIDYSYTMPYYSYSNNYIPKSAYWSSPAQQQIINPSTPYTMSQSYNQITTKTNKLKLLL